MNLLDMRTVVISYGVSNLICIFAMFALWRLHRRMFAGIGFWLSASILQWIGVVLIALRDSVPDILSITATNFVLISGLILFYVGLEYFTGERGPQRHNILFLAIFTLVQSFFTFVFPSLAARQIIYSLAVLLICAQCAWLMLYRVKPDKRSITNEVGVVMIVYCIVSVARIGVTLTMPSGSDFFNTNTYDVLLVATYQMLLILLVFALSVMVNHRLAHDLKSDIAARKKVEEHLRISEEKFSKAFHADPDAILITRLRDGKLIEVNEGFCRMFGHTREDALFSSSISLNLWLNPLDRQKVLKGLQENQKIRDYEFNFRTKPGRVLDILCSAELIYIDDEAHILSVLHDVTELKRAENALRSEQEFINKALDTQDDTFFLFDGLSGKALRWNRAFREISGYADEEIASLPAPFSYYSAQDLEHANSAVQRIMQGETVILVLDFICKDGRKIVTEYQAAPLKDENGVYRFIIAIGRNVAERKRVEQALQQAQAQLMEQQRAMAVFDERERLARELHDGLGQTFGFVNLQTQAARELIQQEQGQEAAAMLSRLVDITDEAQSNLRSYIQTLKSVAPVPRQEFLAALENYCLHLRQAYFFNVRLILPQNFPTILASPQVEMHLTYIIREALSNSRRYSGINEANVRIEIDENDVHAIIQDDGAGFEPGYTGPERRKNTHYGLAMMRERVRDVDGSISIESAAGKGTCVTVCLPRNMPSEGLPPERILIVDDHPLFVEGLKNMLTVHGVQIVGIATNGVEAFEMAAALQPGIILMDINMPCMDGLEATRRIKEAMPGVKIIMLTTSAEEAHIFDALRAGASGYLLKSMKADEFIVTLSQVSCGEVEFSAETANKILSEFLTTTMPGVPGGTIFESATRSSDLSERQVDILRLVAQGLVYKEIGDRLFITERTVKYHVGEILARLQLKNKRDLQQYARRTGLA